MLDSKGKGIGNREQVGLESSLNEKTENLPPPRPWTISFPSLILSHEADPPHPPWETQDPYVSAAGLSNSSPTRGGSEHYAPSLVLLHLSNVNPFV